jgi:mannose/fructose/N-acetylgalactosamine-specific phosphotransferase system component IIC
MKLSTALLATSVILFPVAGAYAQKAVDAPIQEINLDEIVYMEVQRDTSWVNLKKVIVGIIQTSKSHGKVRVVSTAIPHQMEVGFAYYSYSRFFCKEADEAVEIRNSKKVKLTSADCYKE